jgi:hypothetical protein
MKKLLRVIGWILSVFLVFIAFAMAYSTAKGYMTWYFRMRGVVTVDGRKTNGYLHANTARTALMITRTDGSEPETYLLTVKDRGTIIDCGDWHPIRFLPAPIGDLSPPCSVFTNPASIKDGPRSSVVVTSRRSVEFSTASNKRVKAEW